MSELLKLLAIFVRSVTILICDVPADSPVRNLASWVAVESQARFLDQLMRDVKGRADGR